MALGLCWGNTLTFEKAPGCPMIVFGLAPLILRLSLFQHCCSRYREGAGMDPSNWAPSGPQGRGPAPG